MMRKIEEIPKEELQDDATFIAAVASAMKKSKEEQLGITDCPCGGKIKFWHSNYKGHKTVIAKCNRCHKEIRGSSGALEAYEKENQN